MTRSPNKLLVTVLVVHFALLATGSVLLHQIVGQRDCGCLGHHQHTFADHEQCDCSDHGAGWSISDPVSPDEKIAHDCPICQYYQQRIQIVSYFDGLIQTEATKPFVESSFRETSCDPLFSHPARGPPTC